MAIFFCKLLKTNTCLTNIQSVQIIYNKHFFQHMDTLLGSKSSMFSVSSTDKRSLSSTSNTNSVDSNLNMDEKVKHSKLIV